MQIYKQVLKEDESLCKPKDIVNAFPETKRFMDRYGKYCVCTKFTSGRYKIRLYSDKYEYIMSFNPGNDGRVYCSGFLDCRIQGIMENWKRGNDMADGYDIEHVLDRFEREMLEQELTYIGDTILIDDSKNVEVETIKN